MSIKLAGNKDNTTEALNRLGSAWKTYLPQVPFEYTFLDERFDQLYQSEERQGQLFTVFSGIAIFIACLGLLGLSAFSISQRIKEIGIRKVLGARAGAHRLATIHRFSEARRPGRDHRLLYRRVRNAQLAAEFRLSYLYPLVDFPDRRIPGRDHRPRHHQLPGAESRLVQPRE
jgi:hypothetical protein